MILKAGAILLILWGLLNAVGGAIGARGHPASWIGILFMGVGIIITAGGVGFWLRRPWASAVASVGLVGLSGVALLSAFLLRGAAEIRLSHHATRLVLSALFLAVALAGSRRVR